jgi:ligand-binding sensor domain-containing protein/signal transduction histidine kinase
MLKKSTKGRRGKQRMAMLLLLGVLHGISVIAAAAQAAPLNYVHRVWQVQDGLPEDIVQAFAQTPDRYLWIGTTAGLVRFDGDKFVIFDHRKVPQLRQNSVLCLFTDRDGGLWIGTEGGGLVLYKKGTFRLYSAGQGLTDGFIRNVQQDRQGRIWVGTDGGLFRIAGNKVERVDGKDGVPALSVHAIREDAEGRMWAAGTRILRFDHDQATEYRLRGDSNEYQVKAILIARDGTTWVGAVSGLYKLDARGVEERRAFEQVKRISSTVRALWQGNDGALWAGTIGDGIYVLRGEGLTRLRSPDWLPSNTVLYFFEDSEKDIWVGSQHGMLRLSQTSVSTIPLPGASDSDFGTIYQDANQDLWMASSRLFRIRGGTARAYDFPQIGAARVRNVFRDREGGFWIGTDGAGAFRILAGKVDHFTVNNGLISDFIRVFLESSDGSIWIGADGGLSRLSSGSFTNYNTQNGLVYSSVHSLLEDLQGDIWVGTDHGVSHIHGGEFKHDEATELLKEERVWSLHQDSEGGLWFGTRTDGLFRWKSGAITQYTTAQGLASDSIFQILEDAENRFWLSGPAGVSLVRRGELDRTAADPTHRLAVKLFGISQGVEMTEIYGGRQPAGVLGADGVWFPSGREALHLSAVDGQREEPPPVVIDQVLVDGLEQTPAGSLALKPDSRKVQFDYTAVSLRSPEDIRFRYKLEGFDKEWADSGGRREVYYTNLPAGNYTFRAVAFNADDPLRMSAASLAVRQEPYFYRTPWFVLCCLLLLGALVWISHLWRVQQVKLRFEAVLEERGRVAREMHDTLIQGCVSVSTLLEGVSSQSDGAGYERSSLLDYARAQLRLTLDDARRALWNLRRDETLTTEIGPLLISLAEEIAKEAHTIITCETTGQPYSIQTAQAREILMVTREAIYNAVHHSGSSSIRLRIDFREDSIQVRVADDGRGFDPQAASSNGNSGHYGLTVMRERVERMKGVFSLTSKRGSGTEICFQAPCHPQYARSRSKDESEAIHSPTGRR